MTDTFDVPVALFVFNRPDCVARVLSTLRTAQPRLLFVVADGARPSYPEDILKCRAALKLIESIDWPCEIRRSIATDNLGCDRRLSTGLDWVFRQVTAAIILEDDIVPDPSFFPWCAAMLQRYRDEPAIMHISGRNELGRWGDAVHDHIIARRGSVWGWATWARAWFGVDRSFTQSAQNALDRLTIEPLLVAELTMLLDLLSSGRHAAWDSKWSLGTALAGGLSVIPPINLITNIGFGAQATRLLDEGDLRAGLPCGSVVRPDPLGATRAGEIDNDYDRWSLLLALMATYLDPAVARKLASFAKAIEKANPTIGHHLAPFVNPKESIAVLEHLRSIGVSTPRLAALHAELSAELNRRRDPIMAEVALTVGVIVPVRNGARHLGRALKSVLSQQPAPVDVVVIDGASDDDSVSVARAFPGVRVVAQQGRGLAAARNQGLKVVSGALVGLCDSDDRWSGDALAVRIAALKNHPETMAVTGRVVLEGIEGAVPNSAQIERLGQSVPGFTPGALLARQQLFDSVGLFDEDLTIGCDSDWFVRLQQSSAPWMQIGAVVLQKGARGDSLSTDVAHYRRELLTVARRFVYRRRKAPVP